RVPTARRSSTESSRTTRSGRSRSLTTAATSGTRSGRSSRRTTSPAARSLPARSSSCRNRLSPGRGYDRRVDLDVVFLGTSASAPTARRGTSSLLVRRGGDRLLLDCGEGTQRQLLRSTVGLVDLEHVFLSHLHADHYLGLPGMLKTFALRMREPPLTVYGPA